YFTRDELSILDAPTASPFTMESVGGNYGEEVDNLHGATSNNERPESSVRLGEDDSTERGEAAGELKLNDFHQRSSFRGESNGMGGDDYEQRLGSGRLSYRSRSRSAQA
ncbi:MAG: hypothetical protein Q9198_010919, partial [Flavoplaca austrocitrina]